MADNTKMRKAAATKNDEFYTCYDTISNEVEHYRDQFKGKVIYCNCDDPTWSNFWKYFHSNFASLGLKKLIATHYAKDSQTSYAMIYEGGNDFDMDAGKIIEIASDDNYPAGDFRSKACLKLLNESSIVCTNPPFSLFREYVAQLMEYGKKFLIIGNQNAITYKEFFPLLKENKVWLGYSSNKTMVFRVPDGYRYDEKITAKMDDGFHYGKVPAISWFTNMDVKYRHDGLWHLNGKFDDTQAHKYYEGNESYYPTFDNYPDVINVSKTKDIPIDFTGVMAVPVTWLDKYNPDEFEILEGSNRYGIFNYWGLNDSIQAAHSHGNNIKGQATYFRIHVKNRNPISKDKDLGYKA